VNEKENTMIGYAGGIELKLTRHEAN